MTAGPDVLFIGHGGERSGPPVMLLHLQRWLAEHTDLTMATLLANGGPLVDEFERQGPVAVRDDGGNPARLIQRALRRGGRPGLAERLESTRSRRGGRRLGRPGLVYANTIAPQTASLVRAVLRGDVGLLLHVHELASTLRNRIRPDDLRWLLARADRVVAASCAVQAQLVDSFGTDPDRVIVCHEFVEPVAPLSPRDKMAVRASLGLAADAFVIAASGRLDWRKAPELLAQAVWRLRRHRPDVEIQVVWIGAGGDDRWQLEHDLATMGLDDTFRLVGEQPDPGPWIQAADVFASTSREDAFPLACLEAAGVGLPLVTFDTGGMVEFVEASSGGIVAPYPDVDAFSLALLDLLVDDDKRATMGRDGAAEVNAKHTVDVGAARIHAEIAPVLDRADR